MSLPSPYPPRLWQSIWPAELFASAPGYCRQPSGLRRTLPVQIPMVMVTHDEEEAKYLGDIVIQLDKGKSKEIVLQ